MNKQLIGPIAPAIFYGGSAVVQSLKRKFSGSESSPNNMKYARTSRVGKARARSRTTTTTKKRVTKSRSHSLKKAILGVSEAKHNTNHAAFALTHAEAFSFSPTQSVTQGTSRQNRIADEIYLEAIKIRGFINTDAEANAYTFRLMVLYSEKEYDNTVGTLGDIPYKKNAFGAGDLFQDNTGVAPLITGVVDSKRCTVLFDKTIDINSQTEDNYDIATISETIQLQKSFPYRTQGGVYGKNTNLYIVLIPYHLPKTGHTTFGGATLDTDLIFKE